MVVTEAYIRRALERSEDEVKARLVLEVLWRSTSWVELYASLLEAGSLQLGHGRGGEAAPRNVAHGLYRPQRVPLHGPHSKMQCVGCGAKEITWTVLQARPPRDARRY